MRSELERLCDRENVSIEAEYGAVEVPEGWHSGTHPYRVTLKYQRRQLTTSFFMGPANEEEPTAASVLHCLIGDVSAGELSFEEFCSDLGYEEDSRKAERIWKACAAMAPKVKRFLGASFEKFERAEH